MADFVAVLKKTIDGLSENTPQLREKVYRKARDTISAKLAAMQPPPPAVVVDRQRKALEDAINAVEASYTARQDDDDFDSVLADLGRAEPVVRPAPVAPPPPAPAAAAPAVEPVSQKPSAPVAAAAPVAASSIPAPSVNAPMPPMPQASQIPFDPVLDDEDDAPAQTADDEDDQDAVERLVAQSDTARGAPSSVAPDKLPPMRPAPRFEVRNDPLLDGEGDEELVPVSPTKRAEPPIGRARLAGDLADQDNQPAAARRGRRVSGGLIAAVIAVVALGGAGYAVWMNRDAFGSLFGSSQQAANQPATPAPASTAPAPAGQQQAALPSSPATPPQAAQPDAVQKFTQRLTADGREIDQGKSGDKPAVGEGTSTAAATPPPAARPAGAAPSTPATAGAQTAEQTLPVGQRAVFYEEKTTAAQGSAEEGSTVWSVVQESPGGDRPPEPAIRAEVRVPGRDMQLRMTIRRNADASLPASHIVEMIFLTSGTFEGGGIQSVLRMSMKGSEAAPGNPLIGIPAKIADGYFLFALSNNNAEQQANLQLLLRQSWIDVPISYNSGRRALVTMEKGVPGDKVFQQVIQGWQNASSAQAAPTR